MNAKRRNDEEHLIQCAVIEWRDLAKYKTHELRCLFAIPNGGRRDPITGARLKREGVTAGVPDLVLAVSRGGYNALWIEIKTASGRLSPSQREMHAWLIHEGNKVVICRSADEAIETIMEYLRG